MGIGDAVGAVGELFVGSLFEITDVTKAWCFFPVESGRLGYAVFSS